MFSVTSHSGINTLQSAIHNLQSVLESLGHTYADQRALLAEKVRDLREEGERLQREIAQLRTGDRDASYEAEAPAAGAAAPPAARRAGPEHRRSDLPVPGPGCGRRGRGRTRSRGCWGRRASTCSCRPNITTQPCASTAPRRFKDDLHGVGLPDGDRILAAARLGEIRRGGPTGWPPKCKPTSPLPAPTWTCCSAVTLSAKPWKSYATSARPSPASASCAASSAPATSTRSTIAAGSSAAAPSPARSRSARRGWRRSAMSWLRWPDSTPAWSNG